MNLLLNTTDAMVWAEEWCAAARRMERHNDESVLGDQHEVIDEGWMVAWFANAIETGRTAGLNRAASSDDALLASIFRKLVLSNQYVVWGGDSQPFTNSIAVDVRYGGLEPEEMEALDRLGKERSDERASRPE